MDDAKPRPSRYGAINLAASGFLYLNTGAGFAGPGASLSLRMLGGNRFPDANGGNWLGGYLEPLVAVDYFKRKKSGEYSYEWIGSPGVGLGVQRMYFGPVSRKTKKQRGFGVSLGFTPTFLFLLKNDDHTKASWVFGSQVGLVFPTYDTESSSYSAMSFTIVPVSSDDEPGGILELQFTLW